MNYQKGENNESMEKSVPVPVKPVNNVATKPPATSWFASLFGSSTPNSPTTGGRRNRYSRKNHKTRRNRKNKKTRRH